MAPRAFICGLSGAELSEAEAAFLREAAPWGVILFKRNTEAPGQIRLLCERVRETLERDDAPILIDQEGGLVQRFGAPFLRAYPPGGAYGRLYATNPFTGVEAAYLGARLIAADLAALGISVNCMPVLDVPAAGMTNAIGDRALGDTADKVVTLGGAQIDGVIAAGMLPVIKHMPGHGRATVDSHHELPRVDAAIEELEAQDFVPFRLLAGRAPLGMTAHVVFTAIDDGAPATFSAEVVGKVIRGRIGFDGALMTDDLSMGALAGSMRERAERSLAAGCDLLLHCNGRMAEMQDVAAVAPELAGDALRRTDAALAARGAAQEFDRTIAEARFNTILTPAVAA